MKNLVSLASMTLISVLTFEGMLNIVPRYNAGTIQADVSRVQGEAAMNLQIVGATPEQTEMLRAAHENKVQRNMKAIRKHVDCVNDANGLAATCKEPSPK